MTRLGKLDARQVLESGRRVLEVEARAVLGLASRLDVNFVRAIEIVLACKGRVVVSGIGKSGHIARKIASTFASTGTPAFFVHPAEASHGDLGMVTRDDVMIALSNSGESGELLLIVPLIKRMGGKLIAMTGNVDSPLAVEADVHLDAGVDQEACSLGLAPTSSTTAALALGDALAVTLLEARGFRAEDFARSHPGGSLGPRRAGERRRKARSAGGSRQGDASFAGRQTAGRHRCDAIVNAVARRLRRSRAAGAHPPRTADRCRLRGSVLGGAALAILDRCRERGARARSRGDTFHGIDLLKRGEAPIKTSSFPRKQESIPCSRQNGPPLSRG